MSRGLEQLHAALSSDLNRIVARFKTRVRVTLVIRQPEVPGDTGIVIGNDDTELAIAEIRQQEKTGTVTGPSIEDLIGRSSLGAAMRDIAERGIDAHTKDLEAELAKLPASMGGTKRRRKR